VLGTAGPGSFSVLRPAQTLHMGTKPESVPDLPSGVLPARQAGATDISTAPADHNAGTADWHLATGDGVPIR